MWHGLNDGVNLWGSAGYGRGKIEIDYNGNNGNAKTTMLSLLGGVKSKLAQQGMSLKGDISLARTQVGELTGDIMQVAGKTVKSQQLRLILEFERERALESGDTVTPVLEAGLRYDDGSGENGIWAVLGAGVVYTNATGLIVEGKAHGLVGNNDYKEWGVSGVIRQQASGDGRGLAFSLSPSYGKIGSNANQVWDQKLPVGDGNKTHDDNMRVKARMDYGLPAPGGGLLTRIAK